MRECRCDEGLGPSGSESSEKLGTGLGNSSSDSKSRRREKRGVQLGFGVRYLPEEGTVQLATHGPSCIML